MGLRGRCQGQRVENSLLNKQIQYLVFFFKRNQIVKTGGTKLIVCVENTYYSQSDFPSKMKKRIERDFVEERKSNWTCCVVLYTLRDRGKGFLYDTHISSQRHVTLSQSNVSFSVLSWFAFLSLESSYFSLSLSSLTCV